MDENFVVGHAVTFLGLDLNPHWFKYHPLPMYLLALVYAALYPFWLLTGQVADWVDFAALLFDDDAVFYVTARLVSSLVHTAGCAILAWIVGRYHGSWWGAALCFVAMLLIPDGATAANYIRVDTFLFLFLALMVWFALYVRHQRLAFWGGTAACAATLACKIPALVLAPVLFVKWGWDVRRGALPARYLIYFLLAYPAFLFLFMPYPLLDSTAYRKTLNWLSYLLSGNKVRVGREYHMDLASRLGAIGEALMMNVGAVSITGAVGAGLLGSLRDHRLLFVGLFAAAYTTVFATSPNLDGYWLRPVYPVLVFLTVTLLVEVARSRAVARLLDRLTRDRGARWAAPLLLSSFAVYFGGTFYHTLSTYHLYMADTGPDTRRVASQWIEANLAPGSTVILDGTSTHFLPQVFTLNPRSTVIAAGYGHARFATNRFFLTAAARHIVREAPQRRAFRVVRLRAKAVNYDLRRIRLPRGAYVVISSTVFGHYYRDPSIHRFPKLSANAQAYYAYIRGQAPVRTFHGTGPDIEIYRVR